MKIEWTEEMLEKAAKLNRRTRAAIELEAVLYASGLDSVYHPVGLIGTIGKAILSRSGTVEEFAEGIRELKKVIPDAKKMSQSMWSPYADVVLIENMYQSETYDNIPIGVWLEVTVDTIPEEYKDGGCKFVAQQYKSYSLVCEK